MTGFLIALYFFLVFCIVPLLRKKISRLLILLTLPVFVFFVSLFRDAYSSHDNPLVTTKTFSIPANTQLATHDVLHEWPFKLRNRMWKKYAAQISLINKDVEEAREQIVRASSWDYSHFAITTHWQIDPVEWHRQYYQTIYSYILTKERKRFKRIAEGFQEIARQEGMDQSELLGFMVAFVQNMQYKIPDETQLGLLPPTLTIDRRYGDCDTKVLLLKALLDEVPIKSVILLSLHHKHAMIGIQVNATGDHVLVRNERYYFLETTYPNWNIGVLPPVHAGMEFWKTVEI